jgi:hypothetical protein
MGVSILWQTDNWRGARLAYLHAFSGYDFEREAVGRPA